MKVKLVVAMLSLAVISTSSISAMTMPAPTIVKKADCYSVQGNKVMQVGSCQLRIAKVSQPRLGKSTNIKLEHKMYYINERLDEMGEVPQAIFAINGVSAERYLRDSTTMKTTTLRELENKNRPGLVCYKSILNHICHSF